MSELRLGYSFCPNDTFIFHALTHGLVPGIQATEVLEDVDTLNSWAREGRLELTKVSYHAYFHVLDRYVALRSGGALGRGVGPLLVSRPGAALQKVFVPGEYTTAALLLRLARPDLPSPSNLRYDRIIPALQNGAGDAGVLIHESRFVFEQYGLEARLDLGEWWQAETGLPLPLGVILARRDLGPERLAELNAAVRTSLELAYKDPEQSKAYIRQHAHELSEDTVERHIRTYVNEFSLDVGPEGEAAVHALFHRAVQAGVVRPSGLPLFV